MGNYLRVYTAMGIYYGPYGSFSARVGSGVVTYLHFSSEPKMTLEIHIQARDGNQVDMGRSFPWIIV